MKTILVDAINCFVINGQGVNQQMHQLLEKYPNKKIILTGANDQQIRQFGLDKMPYPVFTLKHDPEKSNPEYYLRLLKHYDLEATQVIYFEHNINAVESAKTVGIKTHFYDKDDKDLVLLKKFLDETLWSI